MVRVAMQLVMKTLEWLWSMKRDQREERNRLIGVVVIHGTIPFSVGSYIESLLDRLQKNFASVKSTKLLYRSLF
jgi:hypothetical protein